jgi:TldD protein
MAAVFQGTADKKHLSSFMEKPRAIVAMKEHIQQSAAGVAGCDSQIHGDFRTVKQLAQQAMDTARLKGARYADIRIIESRSQTVGVKDGVVTPLETLKRSDSVCGSCFEFLGIRLECRRHKRGDRSRHRSGCGNRQGQRARPGQACRSRPAGAQHRHVRDVPSESIPFSVSIEEKVGLLLNADAIVRRNPGVKVSEGRVISVRHRKDICKL